MSKEISYQSLEKTCHELIKNQIIPILQSNYKKLYESAKEKGDEFFLSDDTAAQFKEDGKGLVSDGEIEAERVFRQHFKKAYPEIAIFGEECGDENKAPWILVIDPVDGTSAMIENSREHNPALGFGITLGFIHENNFVGGLIYELNVDKNGNLKLGDIWSAWEGQGTYKNKEPQYIQDSDQLTALISTAPEVMFTSERQRSAFHSVELNASKVITGRNCMGFMDIINNEGYCALEADLSIHDAAALIPIIKEAGGIISDLNGNEIKFEDAQQEFRLLCAPKTLHEKVFKRFSAALNDKLLVIAKNSVLNKEKTLNTSKFNNE